jgi:hypothetical protein
MRHPRTIHARLLLTIMATTTLIVVIATIAFSLAPAHALSDDADDVARLRTAAELTKVRVRGGRIIVTRHAEPVDFEVWVLQGDRTIMTPSVAPAVNAAVLPFVRSHTDFVDVPGQGLRLHAIPVKDASRARGHLLNACAGLRSYRRSGRRGLSRPLHEGFIPAS